MQDLQHQQYLCIFMVVLPEKQSRTKVLTPATLSHMSCKLNSLKGVL